MKTFEEAYGERRGWKPGMPMPEGREQEIKRIAKVVGSECHWLLWEAGFEDLAVDGSSVAYEDRDGIKVVGHGRGRFTISCLGSEPASVLGYLGLLGFVTSLQRSASARADMRERQHGTMVPISDIVLHDDRAADMEMEHVVAHTRMVGEITAITGELCHALLLGGGFRVESVGDGTVLYRNEEGFEVTAKGMGRFACIRQGERFDVSGYGGLVAALGPRQDHRPPRKPFGNVKKL